MDWTVYIIEASDSSLYTGISTDPQRRLREHRSATRGARFFRGREPRSLLYLEPGHTRSSACCREAEIKRWPRERKLALIASTREHMP
jgi:putative endonuclease